MIPRQNLLAGGPDLIHHGGGHIATLQHLHSLAPGTQIPDWLFHIGWFHVELLRQLFHRGQLGAQLAPHGVQQAHRRGQSARL